MEFGTGTEFNQDAETEKEKMLSGKLYDGSDLEITEMRKKATRLLRRLNSSKVTAEEIKSIITKLFGKFTTPPVVVPPFYCDYGSNIHLGKNVYFNFNCVVLDVCNVKIGDDVLIGPNVQIYSATHPLEWETREMGLENGKPITIGNNVWIGGSAVICPGVTIGDKCVIGAGSVVTKDIPAGMLAAGNPARVIKKIA